jgi:hypothetical protein
MAKAALRDTSALGELLRVALPADLLARFLDLAGGADLAAVASLSCRRYAVENDRDRFMLDVAVRRRMHQRNMSAKKTPRWPRLL